jgi:3-oxoacyl-[acyl-carrier-protein] synthase-3
VENILEAARLRTEDIDLFILHQATRKMLEQLRERLTLSDERMPIILKDVGNTVSSTIPIVISELRAAGRIVPGRPNMLIGFGVGWSWAGCVWREARNDQ